MSQQPVEEVILFSFDYPPLQGGIARLCHQIYDQLSRRSINVSVLTQQHPGENLSKKNEIRVNHHRGIREWQSYQVLQKRASDQTLIIASSWYPEGLIASTLKEGKVLIMAHGSELLPHRNLIRRPLWEKIKSKTLRKADLILANSEYTLNLVKEYISEEQNAHFIPLSVDHKKFSPGDGKQKARKEFDDLNLGGKRIISTVARIHCYKGFETVFKAISKLPKQTRKQIAYLIVGSGPDVAFLKNKVEDYDISSHVHWIGHIPDSKLQALYRATDLFLLCSVENRNEQRVEGFGQVFLEAQSSGTAVLGTRSGGIVTAVSSDFGGYLVDENDSQGISEILQDLIVNPQKYVETGKKARQRIEDNFTWCHYFLRFFEKIKEAGIQINDRNGKAAEFSG